jgi:hypothetical protein
MQKFKGPLTLEDQNVALRLGRTVLIIYSLTALALTAGVVAHIALKYPPAAAASVEPTDPNAPNGFMRAGSRFEKRNTGD